MINTYTHIYAIILALFGTMLLGIVGVEMVKAFGEKRKEAQREAEAAAQAAIPRKVLVLIEGYWIPEQGIKVADQWVEGVRVNNALEYTYNGKFRRNTSRFARFQFAD